MLAFVAFQMMFAAITPALITGSVAERVNFSAWILMMALWSLCVYAPVAHWVWGTGGWIAADGGLDFAGGLVVHITAGVAGLICAKTFGRRINADEVNHPNDISMIMLGGALLWFGWFGFNAGSAITSGQLASHAFMTTYVGASASFLAWMMFDWLKHKRPSAVGATIGLVVGLVTITPAAGYVSIQSAIIMCVISGIFCNIFTHIIKTRTKLDDALDVFACHGMGGILGAIMTGLFAETAINPAVTVQGLFISGEVGLLFANIKAVIAVCAYTAVVTYALIKIVNLITPIRISEEHEVRGLDDVIHGEAVTRNI
jgi:Amt family ammonium transporter